jgi:hypothetical protein
MHKNIIWATMAVIQFPFHVSDIAEKNENNPNQSKK